MYVFYMYLWINYLWLYTGKAGWNGFDMFMNTLFTAPLYIIYHLITIFIAKSNKNKPLLYISITGLLLCIIHVSAVFS